MKVVAKRVEMVAYFEEDGKIKPIRFRFKEDDEYKVCLLYTSDAADD